MRTLTDKLKYPLEQSKVTKISSNARIDYIMRFSKHAVLVVDSNNENYSLIGSQFLGTLPEGHNAAFISVSTQLNDIQIRCRLIEQLFSDVLFDPEEPLAVTVLKLVSDKTQVISIVVENVHLLSLQLMHEFCQLADLAAKADRGVNVLLLGSEKAGKLVSANKTIFNNKLSIVSAGNGQLIPFDSELFENGSRIGMSTSLKKAFLAIVILVILSLIIVRTLYTIDNSSFADLQPDVSQVKANTITNDIKGPDIFIQTKPETVVTQATAKDIYQWLSKSGDTEGQIIENNITASAELASSVIVENSSLATEKIIKQPNDSQDFVKVANSNQQTNLTYYTNFNSGYVVQIISCTKRDTYDLFMIKYKELGLFGYPRLSNSDEVMVVTSSVYPLKSDAIAAISMLPNELQEIGPWVKSIEAIKNEIEEYQNNLYPITIAL
jgi:DamX protein